MAESASHSKKFLKQHRAIQLIEDTEYLLKWCLESYMDTCFKYDIFLVVLEDTYYWGPLVKYLYWEWWSNVYTLFYKKVIHASSTRLS